MDLLNNGKHCPKKKFQRGEIFITLERSRTEFPSLTHKSIWHAAMFLAPFQEVIPPGIAGGKAQALREGEKSLYRLMLDLFTDMYAHPEAYLLPVGEYDRYMQGRESKADGHHADQKECRLRNRFQQAIQFYQKLPDQLPAL